MFFVNYRVDRLTRYLFEQFFRYRDLDEGICTSFNIKTKRTVACLYGFIYRKSVERIRRLMSRVLVLLWIILGSRCNYLWGMGNALCVWTRLVPRVVCVGRWSRRLQGRALQGEWWRKQRRARNLAEQHPLALNRNNLALLTQLYREIEASKSA